MRQLLELIPIILFFLAYKMDGETHSLLGFSHHFDGIFSATAVLMLATSLQLLLTQLVYRKVEKQLLWLWLAVMIFGGATLLLRNEAFIQWKPTIFNWGLALVFLASSLFGERSLLQRMLGGEITLPAAAWRRLNQLWIGNFLLVGGLNLYVAQHYAEATWVSYKLYSAIGFTVALMIATMLVIFPHLEGESSKDKP